MTGFIKFYAQITQQTSIQEEALANGLVTEIKSSLIPAGAGLVSIFDNQTQQSIPLMPGIMPLRGFIAPEPQNFSSITNSFSSIKGY